MGKTHRVKIPNPDAPVRERLDAGPTIRHERRIVRNREAGWDEYYAHLDDIAAEHDDYMPGDFE